MKLSLLDCILIVQVIFIISISLSWFFEALYVILG